MKILTLKSKQVDKNLSMVTRKISKTRTTAILCKRLFLHIVLYDEIPWLLQFLPLKVGVHEDLCALYPTKPRWHITGALYQHTHDYRYLRNVLTGKFRYNLNGDVCGTVDAHAKRQAQLYIF